MWRDVLAGGGLIFVCGACLCTHWKTTLIMALVVIMINTINEPISSSREGAVTARQSRVEGEEVGSSQTDETLPAPASVQTSDAAASQEPIGVVTSDGFRDINQIVASKLQTYNHSPLQHTSEQRRRLLTHVFEEHRAGNTPDPYTIDEQACRPLKGSRSVPYF